MSTYNYIGCEKCREDTPFVRDGIAGFGGMGWADKDVILFLERHRSCFEHLRIYNEFDTRSEDFSEFDAKAFEDELNTPNIQFEPPAEPAST